MSAHLLIYVLGWRWALSLECGRAARARPGYGGERRRGCPGRAPRRTSSAQPAPSSPPPLLRNRITSAERCQSLPLPRSRQAFTAPVASAQPLPAAFLTQAIFISLCRRSRIATLSAAARATHETSSVETTPYRGDSETRTVNRPRHRRQRPSETPGSGILARDRKATSRTTVDQISLNSGVVAATLTPGSHSYSCGASHSLSCGAASTT